MNVTYMVHNHANTSRQPKITSYASGLYGNNDVNMKKYLNHDNTTIILDEEYVSFKNHGLSLIGEVKCV